MGTGETAAESGPMDILTIRGCADLRLTTTGNRQTLVNAQSAGVVSLGAVGTRRAVRDSRRQHLAALNYGSFSSFLFFDHTAPTT